MYIHKAVRSKSILAWGLKINLNCFCTFLVILCVFAHTNRIWGWGLCHPPPPTLLTTLIHDLIGTWLGPTHLCFPPNEIINKNSMLKEVQTWGMFLRKLCLPDKSDIPMYSRSMGTMITVWITQTWSWLLSKCTRVCFEKCINEIKSVWC
jgi:hypothetical protein